MSGADVTVIVYSVAGATVSGLLAGAALYALRRRSVGVQAAVAALSGVLATAIGIAWAASKMFISGHDRDVLWTVLAGAGAVGVTLAALLGRHVTQASRQVGEMVRRLGDGSGGVGVRPLAAPGELTALAAQLEQTSARLAEAQAQAAALERSRRELVAWVSHDLRTPLAGIRAMIEALEDRVVEDDETVARYYATMRREIERLAGLVNDLFELSRIHSGALALDIESVPLDELVGDAVAGAAVAHEIDAVFEMAYRGDAARTPGDGGGGLGLAVARGLVEAHHGEISVHNQGPGCRFTVRLPLQRS
jgi:signal transduction histidine kinase